MKAHNTIMKKGLWAVLACLLLMLVSSTRVEAQARWTTLFPNLSSPTSNTALLVEDPNASLWTKYITLGQIRTYARAGLTTSDVAEGTNLYYTDARVNSRVFDMLVAGSGIEIKQVNSETLEIASTGSGDEPSGSGQLEFVDPDNPPPSVVPNRLYINSGNPNRIVYRTEAGVWREIETSVYTPFELEEPVIESVTADPESPEVGQTVTIEVLMDIEAGLPDNVSIVADGKPLDVTYPDLTTLRALASFTPDEAGAVEIEVTAQNTAGFDTETIEVVVTGDSGDPGDEVARYHGVTATDIFGLIDGEDFEAAEAAVLGLIETMVETPYGTVSVDFGDSPKRFFWVVPAAMEGADSLQFIVNGGLPGTFPFRTLTVGGETYIVYRSGLSLGESTYDIEPA